MRFSPVLTPVGDPVQILIFPEPGRGCRFRVPGRVLGAGEHTAGGVGEPGGRGLRCPLRLLGHSSLEAVTGLEGSELFYHLGQRRSLSAGVGQAPPWGDRGREMLVGSGCSALALRALT